MLKDTIRGDVDDIFMNTDEFAETVAYRQNDQVYNIKAIVYENILDEVNDIAVESITKIYISSSSPITPQIHDVINDKWEVISRKQEEGIWELTCSSNTRLRY